MAIGQRAANGQPRGSAVSDGGRPSSGTSRSVPAVCMFGTERSSPIVYGMCGAAKTSVVVPFSTSLPAYITAIRSAWPATTPRSWVISTTAAPVSSLAFSSTSRIWAWIVTSSAVVGSSAMIRCGSLAIDMAIMARWRIPPENSCGKAFARRSGAGMPTTPSSSTALACAARLPRAESCSSSASAIWSPTV